VRDRVVQMATLLILEPIFEADFEDCSYGFRPNRDLSSNSPGERGRWEQVTDSGRDRRLAVAGGRKTVCERPGGASPVSVSLFRQLRQAS
jgi:hypothetical protein